MCFFSSVRLSAVSLVHRPLSEYECRYRCPRKNDTQVWVEFRVLIPLEPIHWSPRESFSSFPGDKGHTQFFFSEQPLKLLPGGSHPVGPGIFSLHRPPT